MYVCVWQGAPRCIYSQDMLSPPQRVCAYFPRDLLLLLPTMMGSCLFITSSFTPVCVCTYIMLVISILIKYRRREREKESCCCYSRPWLALASEYNPHSPRCVYACIHTWHMYLYIERERERERESLAAATKGHDDVLPLHHILVHLGIGMRACVNVWQRESVCVFVGVCMIYMYIYYLRLWIYVWRCTHIYIYITYTHTHIHRYVWWYIYVQRKMILPLKYTLITAAICRKSRK